MIIKVIDAKGEDKHLLEAARIEYQPGSSSLRMNIFVSVEEVASNFILLYNGDTVYVLNNDGKILDTKRINFSTNENEWICPLCFQQNQPEDETCMGRHTVRGICGYAKPTPDLCDKCVRSEEGCTIAAGLTAGCIRYVSKAIEVN